ncbi:MAG: flagellar filament capping protein FliD [Rhodoferax sp.]|nr:flagellar filament capping protein FliD [Rhodoferax sp.]
MASISSVGIGSGLDVKSIVSQLVALEQKPLDKLKLAGTTVDTKISAFGEFKSMFSTLASAASSLNSLTTWNAVTATSSNTSAVTATALGGTAASNFSVEVLTLAKTQSTASQAFLPTGSMPGAGTLQIQLGTWTAPDGTFTAGTATAVDITVAANDTVSGIASKINGANAGVTATVLTDASGERLLLRSKNSGEAMGFKMSVAGDLEDPPDHNTTNIGGLSRLTYEDPLALGSTMTQQGFDATAKLNGIAISSASNTFSNVVSGVSFTALQETTSAAEISIGRDESTIKTGIQTFVDAYNKINQSMSDATKYDAGTKTSGLFQGDSGVNSLLSAMRGILQAATGGGAYSRLADIGITAERGGNLTLDSAKLGTALSANFSDVKNLFKADTSNDLSNGVAVKFKKFADGLLSIDGLFASKDASLKRSLAQNLKDQTKSSDHISRYEAQLNAKYSALDAKMASLTALNSYVAQQVTTWNKSGG